MRPVLNSYNPSATVLKCMAEYVGDGDENFRNPDITRLAPLSFSSSAPRGGSCYWSPTASASSTRRKLYSPHRHHEPVLKDQHGRGRGDLEIASIPQATIIIPEQVGPHLPTCRNATWISSTKLERLRFVGDDCWALNEYLGSKHWAAVFRVNYKG